MHAFRIALANIRFPATPGESITLARVNYASAGSPTTLAVVRPDGTLLCHQEYGKEGLLVTDLDLATATGLLAARLKHV